MKLIGENMVVAYFSVLFSKFSLRDCKKKKPRATVHFSRVHSRNKKGETAINQRAIRQKILLQRTKENTSQ